MSGYRYPTIANLTRTPPSSWMTFNTRDVGDDIYKRMSVLCFLR